MIEDNLTVFAQNKSNRLRDTACNVNIYCVVYIEGCSKKRTCLFI